MSEIKNFREQVGLSQYTMAKLLGITRSMLNMAEQHLRFLPAAIRSRIRSFSESLQLVNASSNIELRRATVARTASTSTALNYAFLKKKLELYLAEKKLRKMREDHERTKKAIYFLSTLGEIETSAQTFLVQQQYNKALRLHLKCLPEYQQVLEIRVKSIRFEMDELSALINIQAVDAAAPQTPDTRH